MTASKISNGGGPALVVRSKGHGFVKDSSFSQNASAEIYNASKDFVLNNTK